MNSDKAAEEPMGMVKHPPEELCLRMEVEGLKVVATYGNGCFVIGEKYRYVPAALLAKERAELNERISALEQRITYMLDDPECELYRKQAAEEIGYKASPYARACSTGSGDE